ncbi:YdcF family protein [Schleiferilactobacillus harbinensis]|nr:YdcF family protein [Schleiferilactobacillus harbinensis]
MTHHDVVIVLGYPVQSQKNILQRRLARALRYATSRHITVIIVSGKGRIGAEESTYMATWLKQHRFTGELIEEDQSRDTVENLLNVKIICKKQGFHSPVVVTSWFHIIRTWFLLRRLFFAFSLIPSSGGTLKLFITDIALIPRTLHRLTTLTNHRSAT